MPVIRTTKEVAELFGLPEWKIRRLFQESLVPEPAKFGGKRAIDESLIPLIGQALRARGWIKPEILEVANA